MTNLVTDPLTLSGGSDLIVGRQYQRTAALSGLAGISADAISTVSASPSGRSSFVINGLLVVDHLAGYKHIAKYVGRENVPHDIKRMRRYVYELMRRVGTPVIVKKMWTDRDVKNGDAEPSANYDVVYGQSRNRDPLSHGIGFVSKEKSTDEWIDSQGYISDTDTGTPAPKYRGFGTGYLTYIIEPDAAEDYYKATQEGPLIKVQTATAIAPWWPDFNDNDLIVQVELDQQGFIIDSHERYQAKLTNPVSIRGAKEQRGRQEYGGDFGSRYVINQTFEMTLVPASNVLYEVELDR
jgi:hypothetical protein